MRIDDPILARAMVRRRPGKTGGINVRSQPPAQAVQLVRPDIVHLATGHGVVPGQRQIVGQGRIVRRERRSIVPHLVVADIGAGHQRGPRRRAQRAGRVGRVKTHAALDQPVQVGRLHHRVAISAHQKGHQLVGHDKQYVGSVIHYGIWLLSVASGLCYVNRRHSQRSKESPPPPGDPSLRSGRQACQPS